MIKKIKNCIHSLSQRQKELLAFVSVTVSLVYYLFFIQFGIDLTDSFFHINNFIYKVLDPTTFLSSIIGHFFSVIFGLNLITFRLIFVGIIFLMQLMPFLLIEREKRTHFLILFFPISLVFAPTMANYLSYDTFSIFFTTVYICLLIDYLKNQHFYKMVLLSIISAVLVGVRLPNLLALFFTSFVFLISSYPNVKEKSNSIFYYIILSILFYIFLIFVCYGSLQNYFLEFNFYLSLRGKSHGVLYMINTYLYDILKIILFISICSVLIIQKYLPIINIKIREIIATLVFIVLFFWFVFEKSHAYRLGIFLNALIIFIYLFELSKKVNLQNKLMILLLFLFSFIPALGSDTGLHKTSFIFVFLPFVLSMSKKINNTIIYIVIFIIPFTIFQRINSTYNDVSPIHANSKTSIPKLSYIYSSRDRVADIENVKKDFHKFSKLNREVTFYGVKSHIFNYLFLNEKPPFIGYFQSLDNDPELINLNELLNKNNIVLIVFNNSDATLKTDFSKRIVAKGYRSLNKNSYTIFYK